MARLRNHGETIKELEAQGGRRLPNKQRLALPHVVEEFLSLAIERPENYDEMLPTKQREIDRERIGFYKSQEKLRELIALAGVNAVIDLADVRDDRQIRPTLIENFRAWPQS